MTTDNSTAPVQRVSPEDADLWRRMGQCAVELLPSILRGIADDLRQGLNTDSPKFRHIFAATIDQAAAAIAAAPHTAAPVVQPVVPVAADVLRSLVKVIDDRHYGRMPAEVEAAMGAARDFLALSAPASDADSMPAQPTKDAA